MILLRGSSVADHIGRDEMLGAASPLGIVEADEFTRPETSIRWLQHACEAWEVRGQPPVAATTFRNSRPIEDQDRWRPTPALRRPNNPLSNRTRFLIAGATAALFAGYVAFGSSDRPVAVAVAPHSATDIPSVEPFPLRPTSALENRTEPRVQTASLQPTIRLDPQPTESTMEARPTLPERSKQLFARDWPDSTCLLSAAAVRQNQPEGRPSWTMRAPGHEGTRCWYAAPRTSAGAAALSARVLTVESRAESEVEAASFQPTPTEGGPDATCLPSASAVRQTYPGGRPSWTMRAPGHEGTRCWYSAGEPRPTNMEIK